MLGVIPDLCHAETVSSLSDREVMILDDLG